MEAYETLGILGEGTYGVVMKARHRATGKLVAIKRFKQTDEDDHVRKTSTREVRMLQQLKHPNVVRLEDVFRREGKLYLVFEYIDNTILQVLESTTRGIPPRELRRFTYQLLRGLEFCHAHNVIHRDVKPENVLIDQSGMLKLCDFGFARQMTSKGKYTDYVATRWYRAPELLVGDVSYGRPVDVWALGCMFAELSDGQPLFPGESDLDQLCLIIQTCGPVPDRMVSIFEHNPLYRNVSYPHTGIVYTLQERYHRQPEDWLEFLYACLHPDPAKRLTCTELMSLPYFTRDGFRERYEQELKAMSGLPLLRANPTASAPSPTRRAAGEKPTKSKNTLDAAALVPTANTTNATTATTNSNVVGAYDSNASISTKKQHQTVGQKNDVGKHNTSVEGVAGGKLKVSESEGSFLPSVVPASSISPEATVQLPMILNQSLEKGAAGAAGAAAALAIAAQEEAAAAAKSPSTNRRHGPQSLTDGANSRASNSGTFAAAAVAAAAAGGGAESSLKGRQPRSEPFSQSCSAVLSSRRTSSASSLAVSPVKRNDNIVIGSTYPESSRRLSNTADIADGTLDGRRTPAAVVAAHVTSMKEVSGAAAAAGGGGAGVGGGRESRRTSRSSFSNASPRSSSLRSERSEAKLGLSAAQPSSSLSTPSTITNAILSAAAGQPQLPQQQQHPPNTTPLADRLPDLTSAQLHLPAQEKRGSVDTEEIPKPPSQPPYPTSPTSFNGSTLSQPSLNPLAAPPSRERGSNTNNATGGRHGLAKARRSGPYDAGEVPHAYAKKKLTKRKKDGLARRGSRGSSSRSTSHCSPQEQILEALRARNGKQGSASVSAFKLSTPRAASRSQDLHTEEALSRLLDDEKANRIRGTMGSQDATNNAAKRGVEGRGSMLRKERRSKPLHAPTNAAPSHSTEPPPRAQPPSSQQLQQQTLDTVLQPEGSDVAQRASATLLALSALRDSTAALHRSPRDGGIGGGGVGEKYPPFTRHTPGLPGGATDYTVPPPPKTQTKESQQQQQQGTLSQAKKATATGTSTSRSRKPLGVYTLHSARRSLDEGDGGAAAIGTNSTLHVHDTNALASLPSSQYGGFAMPYRRTSKTGSNGGLQPSHPQPPSQPQHAQQQQLSSTKRARKKRSSISGDVSSIHGYPPGHAKEHSSSPPPATTAAGIEKSTPRRRENSGSNKKLLPVMYNAATAAATQM